MCYMPNWLIDKLGVPINGTVVVRNVSLPKAAFAKLRPHKTEFIELSNPKAVLEIGLRTLSCITKNDKIKVEFNNQIYFLDVLEIKNPAGQDCEAADLRETDLRTDFAPPLDYEEVMEKRRKEEESNPTSSSSSTSFVPTRVLSGKGGFVSDHENANKETPKFIPFAGGQRLDGKDKKKVEGVDNTSATSSTASSTFPTSSSSSSSVSIPSQTAKLKPKANLAKYSTKNKYQNFAGAGNKF